MGRSGRRKRQTFIERETLIGSCQRLLSQLAIEESKAAWRSRAAAIASLPAERIITTARELAATGSREYASLVLIELLIARRQTECPLAHEHESGALAAGLIERLGLDPSQPMSICRTTCERLLPALCERATETQSVRDILKAETPWLDLYSLAAPHATAILDGAPLDPSVAAFNHSVDAAIAELRIQEMRWLADELRLVAETDAAVGLFSTWTRAFDLAGTPPQSLELAREARETVVLRLNMGAPLEVALAAGITAQLRSDLP